MKTGHSATFLKSEKALTVIQKTVGSFLPFSMASYQTLEMLQHLFDKNQRLFLESFQ